MLISGIKDGIKIIGRKEKKGGWSPFWTPPHRPQNPGKVATDEADQDVDQHVEQHVGHGDDDGVVDVVDIADDGDN